MASAADAPTASALTATTRGSAHPTDTLEQALIELLTDLHHLCDTCDLDLTSLLTTAHLIHTREAQAA